MFVRSDRDGDQGISPAQDIRVCPHRVCLFRLHLVVHVHDGDRYREDRDKKCGGWQRHWNLFRDEVGLGSDACEQLGVPVFRVCAVLRAACFVAFLAHNVEQRFAGRNRQLRGSHEWKSSRANHAVISSSWRFFSRATHWSCSRGSNSWARGRKGTTRLYRFHAVSTAGGSRILVRHRSWCLTFHFVPCTS